MLTLGPEFKVSPSLFGTAPQVRTNSDHSLFFFLNRFQVELGGYYTKEVQEELLLQVRKQLELKRDLTTCPWGIARNMLLRMAAWFGAGHLVSARSCTGQTIYCTYYILVSKCLLEDMKNHGFSHISKTKKQPFRNYYMEKIDQFSTQEGNVAKFRLTKKPLNNSRGNKTKIFTDHEKTLYHLLGWA